MNSKLQMMLLAQSAMSASAYGGGGNCPPTERKRAVNVSIDAQLLAEAKAMGLNLSQTLETTLRQIVHDAKIKQWSKAHEKSVESYNQFVTGGDGK
ncbi:MAG TPA: type II toxin-antitoxin system CcdA family antitoxin [Rhizomicrobium sp.]|nr:type II toxin-antitoxin system CcdA family antitoxin [Rhizomicrobium sp.]